MTVPVALTIAGSDSSGGAGIQADLKTFAALGVYGASVITALTAQNTTGVSGIFDVPADFITAQLDAVFCDLDIKAVKIGMVSQPAAITAIVQGLEKQPQTPQLFGAAPADGAAYDPAEPTPQRATIPKPKAIPAPRVGHRHHDFPGRAPLLPWGAEVLA